MSILSSAFSGLGGVILGGIITGYFTLLASENDYENRVKEEGQKENILLKSFVQSIHDEIKVFCDMHNKYVDAEMIKLQGKKQAFDLSYGLNQNSFVIYNNNSHLIGRINNIELRHSIVEFYIKIKYLISSYQENNKMLEEREIIRRKQIIESNSDYNKFHTEDDEKLKNNSPKLVEGHRELNELKQTL